MVKWWHRLVLAALVAFGAGALAARAQFPSGPGLPGELGLPGVTVFGTPPGPGYLPFSTSNQTAQWYGLGAGLSTSGSQVIASFNPASPGPIGGTTPASGNFTTVTAASDISGNVNGVINVKAPLYNASGSTQTTTGTTSGSQLTLTSAADFKNGQGILVFGAGPATLYVSAPSAPTVSTVGTVGTTTYSYTIATIDYWGGLSAASTPAIVANGNATESPTNYSKIVVSGLTCNYCAVGVWRTAGGSAQGLIGVLAFGNGTLDDSNLPVVSIPGIPSTPPVSAVNQNFITTISSGGGTTTLTLAASAPSAVANAAVWHDDSQAFQSAIAAGAGKTILVPAGTYNLNQPSWWNGSAWVYANPTTPPPASEMFGVLHLASNITLKGDGRKVTTLSSILFASVYQGMLASANPTATTVPGGMCNSNAEGVLTQYAINNASRGSPSVVLTTPANTSNFAVGDVVRLGGGMSDGQVSCGPPHPSAELNQIVAINASNGTLYLRYPISKDVPFGTVGTAPFVENAKTVTFHDVQISDLTLQTTGGAQALVLSDVVHGRVVRVDMPGFEWSGTINLNEAQDIAFSDIYLHSTGSEEFDQARNIVFDNSSIFLEGGYLQFPFTEGAADILLTHNTIQSDDAYCGYGGRCDLGGPTPLAFTPGGADFRVESNTITGKWVSGGVGLQVVSANAGVPTLSGVRIDGNQFRMTSAGNIISTDIEVPAIQQLISGNDFYLNPGNANAWAIGATTGVISNNRINMATANSFQGVIRLNITTAQTEPLLIENNNIGGAAGNVCMYLTGGGSGSVLIQGNTCANAGTGIQYISGPTPVVWNNQFPGITGSAYLPGSLANYTLAGVFAATINNSCKGSVTLAAGAGTFTNTCVTTSSYCSCRDTTTNANACTAANPAAGSVGITGTGTDVAQVACQ